MGRQTTYTQEVADEICARLSKGEPLAQICRDEGFPAVRTVSDWKKANPDFAASFARARDEGFDAIAESCLEIADEAPAKFLTEGGERVDTGHVQWTKNRIETRLKLLAKWDPRRYGEKLDLSSSDGTMSPKPTIIEFVAPDLGEEETEH